jgi:vacuolar-type H+-ATPase subunit H
LLDHSTRLPLTSRVVMDEDEYLRLVDQMRVSVPQEIAKARQVEADHDLIIAQAREQADAMLEKARENVEALVAEHAIMSQAEERANEILSNAYAEANDIRAGANAYALEVLDQLAAQLEGFGTTVGNGIRLLQQGIPVRAEDPNRPGIDVEPRIIGGDGDPKSA